MNFLSVLYAKAGITVDGVTTLNNTATALTPATNDNSTKIATTAFVKNQNYYPYPTGTTSQYVRGDGSLATFPTVAAEAKTLITEVYNETGATLTKGTVVYINGGHGNLPTVTKALANSDATSAQTYGVVQSDITDNNNGFVVVIGSLTDIPTNGYPNGTILYLSPTTAGGWTSTKPYAPQHIVYVGIVVREHPTQGVIEIRIQNGYEMDELHNVSAQNPANGDILQFNYSTQLWTKTAGTTTNITEGTNLYFTDARARAAISLTTTGTSGAATYSGGVLNIPQYQAALTNPITGTGTTNYLPKFTGTSALGNSIIYDDGTNIALGTTTVLTGGSAAKWITLNGSTYGGGIISSVGSVAKGYLYYDNASETFALKAASSVGATIWTNSAERMRITSAGLVGIGCTDPTGKLEIRGNRSATKDLLLNLSKYDYGATTFYQNYSNTFYTNGKSLEIEVEGLPLLQLAVNNAGSAGKVIFPNGNVGIGTTSPGKNLDVVGTTDTSIRVKDTGGASLELYQQATSSYILATNILITYTGGSERMRVDATGNVVIGAITPTATLDVRSKAASGSITAPTFRAFGYDTDSYFQVNNNASNSADIKLTRSDATTMFQINGHTGLAYFNGNIGVGVTPSAWTSFSVLQNTGGSLIGAAGELQLWQNAYYDGASKYYATGTATRYGMTAGQHRWYYAVSGTANAALTWVQSMTLNESGNLGLGIVPTTSSARTIQFGAGAGLGTNSTNNTYFYHNATIDASANLLYAVTGQQASMYRQINGAHQWLYAAAGTAGNAITFTQQMTLDASGQLLIGTTTSSSYKLDVNGTARVSGALTANNGIFNGVSSTNLKVQNGANANTLFLIQSFGTEALGENASILFKSAANSTDTTYAKGLISFVNNGTGYGRGSLIFATNNSTNSTNVTASDVKLTIAASGEATFSSSVTASSLIKSGGTSSQYLMADGSTSTLTNPITGTGTTNYLPKFTGTSALGDSNLINDSNGNLGLGVTPSNAYADSRAFEIGANGIIWTENATSIYNSLGVGLNFYYNSAGNALYKNTGLASSKYTQYQGEHQWSNAPSGTAGNAISFTQAMTLTNSGRLGIGTTSPSTKFEVYGGHDDTKARLYSTGNGSTLNASLDMWASEPGVSYDGSGIGNNVNGSPFYGRRNSALGQSYIRFISGQIIFYTGTTTANPYLTIAASGVSTFTSSVNATSFTANNRTILTSGGLYDNATNGNNIGIGFAVSTIISTDGAGTYSAQNLGNSTYPWYSAYFASTITAGGNYLIANASATKKGYTFNSPNSNWGVQTSGIYFNPADAVNATPTFTINLWNGTFGTAGYGGFTDVLTINGAGGAATFTSSVTAGGNFELNSATTGLKSNFYDTNFYASSASYWNVTTAAAATYGALLFLQGYGGTTKGYVYWDSSGFGLLNNLGDWAVRANYGGSGSGGTLFGAWSSSGSFTATNFIVPGGTSAQFLKADGSLDSNVYLTATSSTFSYTASVTLSPTWQNTGVSSTNLGTGAYLVTCNANDFGVGGGQYNCTYTGLMYFFAGGTNGSNANEIVLHHTGHADNNRYIYLRTLSTVTADGKTYLQISGNGTNSGASNYQLTFKKLL